MNTIEAKQNELNEIDQYLEGQLSMIRNDGNRSFTAKELEDFEVKEARKEEVKLEIASEKKAVQFKRSEVFGTPAVSISKKATPADANNALRAWLLYGNEKINDNFKRSCDYVNFDYTANIITLKRDQTSDTSGEGAELVSPGLNQSLVAAQKTYGNVESVCDVIRTSANYPLVYPMVDDTAVYGGYVAQAEVVTNDGFTFSDATLNAYPIKTATYPIAWELLEDSTFAIDTFIGDALGQRIARQTNKVISIGAGSGSNEGAGYSAATVEGSAGTNNALVQADLLDLYFSVDAFHRANAVWVMADATFAHLVSVLKTTTNEPLWTRDLLTDGFTYSLLGKPVVINNHAPLMVNGNTCKSIAFGNFKSMKVRYVGDTRLVRDNSRYADKLSSGVFAWTRMDCKLINAGDNPIKHLKTTGTP